MSTTTAYDAIGLNVSTLPGGQHCGYTTGSNGIPWTSTQWINDPSAIRIDQDPSAMDHTADVLDVENGAATVTDIPAWLHAATADYNNRVRPGQREPMVYCNRSTLTAVANELQSSGLTCPVWIASPGMSEADASSEIINSSGPFPIHGVQYAWNNTFDSDVFQTAWLTTVSGKAGDTVSPGSYGPAVAAAQTRINVWAQTFGLHSELAVDGCFGPVTEVAIKAFQGFKGLTADGVIGPGTWTALDAAPDPGPPPTPPVQFAAPKNLVSGNVNLFLSWEIVPAVEGKAPNGYTVAVYKPDGVTLIGTKIVTETSMSSTVETTVVLAPKHQYQIHVWANGGQVAPPHATLNVTA